MLPCSLLLARISTPTSFLFVRVVPFAVLRSLASHNLLKDGLGIAAEFTAIPGMGHSGACFRELDRVATIVACCLFTASIVVTKLAPFSVKIFARKSTLL